MPTTWSVPENVGESGGRLHAGRNRAVEGRARLWRWRRGAIGSLPGNPRQQLSGNAEVQLIDDAEWRGDLLAQRGRQRAPGRAARQLAEHEAERQRVISGPGARRPPWRLAGDEGADAIPVTQVLLAVRPELGPDVGNPLVVAQLAAFHEHVRDRRRDALARRGGEEQRVRGHRLSGVRIGEPGDRVDDNAALVQDGNLEPVLGAGRDQLVDRVLHSPL